jgi:hypothetical protein
MRVLRVIANNAFEPIALLGLGLLTYGLALVYVPAALLLLGGALAIFGSWAAIVSGGAGKPGTRKKG